MKTETILIENLIESPYQGRLIESGTKKSQSRTKQMNELASSIRTSGLLQPITVRQKEDKYEIIDGHRRVEAHNILGIKTIAVNLIDKTDREVQIMSVVANLQRANLNNIEKAISFQKILKAKVFNTNKELSVAIGKDETYVGDILNLLNMDKRVINDLLRNSTTNDVRMLRIIRKAGKIDATGISDAQYMLYKKMVKDHLSRQQLMELVNSKAKKEQSAIQISGRHRKYTLSIMEKLSSDQELAFKKLMEIKIKEALDEIR